MQSMRRCGPPLPPSPPCPGIVHTYTRERGRDAHVRVGRARMYGFPSLAIHAIAPLCIVRGPTFPRATPFSRPPPILFSPPTVFPPPLTVILLFLFPSTLPSIHPLLSSGLNCCNLWPMPVDLTVELSHGDLYGLLILQRSSGGCGTWPWVFIDFQRATNYHHHQGG